MRGLTKKGSRKGEGGPPIYRGGRSSAAQARSLKDLIQMEWRIMDELWALAKRAEYEKHRSVYYQTLASHARTLMLLLKATGETGKETEDLAKILQKMTKKVKKFLRDEEAWRKP